MKKYQLPAITALFVFINLAMIEIMVKKPLFLLDRFLHGAGWIQVILISIYAFIVAYHMQNPAKNAIWRRNTWVLFSIVFFTQLFLGIYVSDSFLMSGKLHLPIPAMIISGPLYRGETSVMTILFISTILLSGPAWCSHLCYFGAIDNYFAKGKTNRNPIANKFRIKHSLLIAVVAVTLLLRFLNISATWAIALALSFGFGGLAVIIFISRKKNKMIHCVTYCPIGTIVNYTKQVSPFQMYLDQNCSACMKCTSFCKYDALNREDILGHKPGKTCTLCGDCVVSCHSSSIKYKFFKFSPEFSRAAYLFITIALHAITLTMARI